MSEMVCNIENLISDGDEWRIPGKKCSTQNAFGTTFNRKS